MTIPQGLEGILKVDSQIMHGDVCFAGTRVPLTIFLDNMADGMSIEDFRRNYPSIKKEQIHAVSKFML